MTEANTPLKSEQQSQLLATFNRMLPILNGLANSLRFAVVLGFGLVIWIFVWLFVLKDMSLTSALIIAGLSVLPILLLLRFWWALEELKRLPSIVGTMVSDAKTEVSSTVQGIRAGQAPKLGLLSSVRNLWKVGSFAGEARDLLGSYLSIGTLVNPFSLLLGVLSLLFVVLLVVVGVILAVLAL